MRFVCLGYFDEKEWQAKSKRDQDAMVAEGLAYDAMLTNSGHRVLPGDALQKAHTARTLRLQDGRVTVTDGPYAETKEQLGGFGFVEARDMDHAVELMSRHPCIRHGGHVEIRPVDVQLNEVVAAQQNLAAPT